MKKAGTTFLALVLVFTLAACTAQPVNNSSSVNQTISDSSMPEAEPTAQDEAGEPLSGDGNILIAYFSSEGNSVIDESVDAMASASLNVKGNPGMGNTSYIASLIQEEIGGDLFFIETVEKYPATYQQTIEIAAQEQEDNARPALASHIESIDDYDVIFLGYPNWWGTLPQPVFTFLDEYDFSGKTIVPFCTHEGSGFGRSVRDLESELAGSTFLDGFTVRGGNSGGADDDVKQWLADLGFA